MLSISYNSRNNNSIKKINTKSFHSTRPFNYAQEAIKSERITRTRSMRRVRHKLGNFGGLFSRTSRRTHRAKCQTNFLIARRGATMRIMGQNEIKTLTRARNLLFRRGKLRWVTSLTRFRRADEFRSSNCHKLAALLMNDKTLQFAV